VLQAHYRQALDFTTEALAGRRRRLAGSQQALAAGPETQLASAAAWDGESVAEQGAEPRRKAAKEADGALLSCRAAFVAAMGRTTSTPQSGPGGAVRSGPPAASLAGRLGAGSQTIDEAEICTGAGSCCRNSAVCFGLEQGGQPLSRSGAEPAPDQAEIQTLDQRTPHCAPRRSARRCRRHSRSSAGQGIELIDFAPRGETTEWIQRGA